MATKKTPAKAEAENTAAAAATTTTGSTDGIAQMPPPGQENKTPEQLAAENKPDSAKALDQAADARIATGGQSGVGSTVPGVQGVGDVAGKTMTAEELKASGQPLAPEHPLEVPDEPKK